MVGIKDLIRAWRGAIQSGQISDEEYADILKWRGDVLPNEGGNRFAVAKAAATLSSRAWPGRVQGGGWEPAWGVESFSPGYGALWAGAFRGFKPFDAGAWWTWARPWLYAHALASGSRPREIWLETPRGRSRHPTGANADEWPWGNSALFSIHPGDRMLWSDPIDQRTLIQRAAHHVLTSLACDRRVKVPASIWGHLELGTPLLAVLGDPVFSPQRPDGWGPALPHGRGAAILHKDLGPLQRRRGWIRYAWHVDGSRSVAIEHSNTGTRGTVNLAVMDPKGSSPITRPQTKAHPATRVRADRGRGDAANCGPGAADGCCQHQGLNAYSWTRSRPRPPCTGTTAARTWRLTQDPAPGHPTRPATGSTATSTRSTSTRLRWCRRRARTISRYRGSATRPSRSAD